MGNLFRPQYGLLYTKIRPRFNKILYNYFTLGKYSYQRLPMGIAGSPEISQEKMSDLMQNLEYVRNYLDDVLPISKSNLKDHL